MTCLHSTKTLIACLLAQVLAAVLLTSCGVDGDKVRISGKFGEGEGLCYIYTDDGPTAHLDTVKMHEGRFRCDFALSQPAIVTIVLPNFYQYQVVGRPGEEVSLKGRINKPSEAEVSGNDENELLTEFRKKSLQLDEKGVAREAAQFIRKNPATMAALVLFRKYFAEVETIDDDEARSLLSLLRKSQPTNQALTSTEAFLAPLLQTAKGQKLNPFNVQTIDGRQLSFGQSGQKPLLVAFLATWNQGSGPVWRILRALEKKYGSRLDILVISLDGVVARAESRAKIDSLAAPIVCDTEGFDSPLVRQFGVRTMPGNLLVDATGEIVDRDIPTMELADRVSKLLP